MSIKKWTAVAACVFAPVAAAHQHSTEHRAPGAAAADGTTRYLSAFKSYRPSVDENDTPDKVWRSANDEAGKLGGHVGHIRGYTTPPVVSTKPDTVASETPDNTGHHRHHQEVAQ
jgi:hypothetical protein